MIQIHDWENHFVITPHHIALVQMETLEFPQLPILCEHRVLRPAQERLEIHDSLFPVVEDKPQLVASNACRFGDFEILPLISTGL